LTSEQSLVEKQIFFLRLLLQLHEIILTTFFYRFMIGSWLILKCIIFWYPFSRTKTNNLSTINELHTYYVCSRPSFKLKAFLRGKKPWNLNLKRAFKIKRKLTLNNIAVGHVKVFIGHCLIWNLPNFYLWQISVFPLKKAFFFFCKTCKSKKNHAQSVLVILFELLIIKWFHQFQKSSFQIEIE
jgi:hypothetical protein